MKSSASVSNEQCIAQRPLLIRKRRRGRPPKIDPYGGILQSVLLIAQKNRTGAPRKIEQHVLLRLIFDIAIHLDGGHNNQKRTVKDACRWLAESGLYGRLSEDQLRDAYNRSL